MTVLPSILTPKNRRLPFLLITLLTLAIFIISVISLVSGELIIFQNLYYFPIILACVYYVKRGFVFSVILACSYFFLMLIFSQDPVVLQGAAIRVLIFILVAGVITYLSIVRIRTEDALRETEDKIHLLLDSTAEAIYGIDMNDNCTFCNSACLRLLGYKRPDELLGKNMHWQIHSKRPDGSPLPVEECRMIQGFHNGKGVHVDDEVFWRSDDTPFPTEYWSYPILRDGVVAGAVVTFLDITDRKKTEEETQRERAFFDQLVETAPEGIAITDTQGAVMRVNTEFVRMFGYGADEAVGQSIDDLVVPPARQEEAGELTKSAGQGSEILLDTVRRRKDGTLVDVSVIAAPILITGKHEAVYVIYRDITKRKRAEEETQRERAFFDQLIETSPEGIAITNTQGRVTRVNAEFLRMFGYGVDEAVGQDIDDLVAPPALDAEAREMTTSSSHGETKFLETVRRRKDGTLVDVSVIAAPVLIAGKQEANYAIYRDITERKQMEQKLEEMATHDFLTGLPNRALLLDRFTIAAALARRNKSRLAVISLDLDKFKSVNDTLGHDAGDQVLKTIGIRLTRIVRASDTFARVGGDEFISVMLGTSRIEDASVMAQKILDSFREPVSVGEHQLYLSTSIGIAIYPDDGDDLETLTKKSDAAMYYSKGHGGNQLKFYRDGDAY